MKKGATMWVWPSLTKPNGASVSLGRLVSLAFTVCVPIFVSCFATLIGPCWVGINCLLNQITWTWHMRRTDTSKVLYPNIKRIISLCTLIDVPAGTSIVFLVALCVHYRGHCDRYNSSPEVLCWSYWHRNNITVIYKVTATTCVIDRKTPTANSLSSTERRIRDRSSKVDLDLIDMNTFWQCNIR